MIYVALLIVSITSLLVAPAVGWTQEKLTPEKVRIAVATSSMAFLVPFVAKDRGFYLKNGADVCVSSWTRIAPNTLPAMSKPWARA